MTQTDSSCLALAQLKPDVFFIVFYTLMGFLTINYFTVEWKGHHLVKLGTLAELSEPQKLKFNPIIYFS